MKIFMSQNRALLTILSALLFAASEWPAFGQTYHLTDLGVINPGPSQISHPAGINNAGAVTGTSTAGNETHAVRFHDGLVDDLAPIPGGNTSMGVGINNLGHVTGDSQYSVNGGSIRHAALWRDGTVIDLGYLPSWSYYSRGNGINDADVVVGHSGPSLSTSNTHAFIWDAANGMRDLGTLGGAYAKAFSINNSNVVTGTSQSSTGGFHAFIWDAANGMRDIGTLAGDTSSGAFINANGHIAGTSTINGFDNREHAFLYDGVTMRDLGAVGNNDFFTDRSVAYGINVHDVVVGSTYRPYGGGAIFKIPFVYRDGQMFDLEQLVDGSGANYRLYTATGINDAGQIAVDAIHIAATNEIRAVLLTPNQELVRAVSRKTHGVAGIFDLDLPLAGPPAVECRSGAAGHTLVFTFRNPVTGGRADVAGAPTMAGEPIYNGNTMTVSLTGVQDDQTLTVTLRDVTDSSGPAMPPVDVQMKVLFGDTTGNGLVNASDVGQVKGSIGLPVTPTDFRADVIANGSINSSDVAAVKANSRALGIAALIRQK